MITNLLSHIQTIVAEYGILGLFIASFTEEVIAPIPSSFVMMSGGFFLFGGLDVDMSTLVGLFISVAIPLAIGSTAGSFILYGITYKYGKPTIDRFGRYFKVSWVDIERIQRYLNRGISDEVVLFLARMLPIVPGVIVNAVAGTLRIPLSTYIPLTFFGVVIRAYAMAFIGWQVGSVYIDYADQISQYEKYGVAGIIGIAIGWWLAVRIYKYRKQRRQSP